MQENINPVKRNLFHFVKLIANIPFVLKFTIFTLTGAFGGAGIISLMVEYSTYRYAMFYGFRPPVEGVPYLRTAASVVGFVMIATSLNLIAGSAHGMKFFFKLLSNRYREAGSFVILIQTVSRKIFILYSIGVALFLSALFCGILYFDCRNEFLGFCVANDRDYIYHKVALGAFISALLIMLMTRYDKFSLSFMIISIVVFNILAIAVIFKPPVYASYLREVGFGGGILVTLELEDNINHNNSKDINGFLMLKTSSVYVIYDDALRRFIEYPVERVRRLSYFEGGLSKLPHRVPEVN